MVVRRRSGPRWGARFIVALRLMIQAVLIIGAIGLVGHFAGLLLVTSTVGPTAYLMLAHPDNVTARVRNAVLGHGAAIGFGLACAAAFGLWHRPPATRLDTMWDQAAAPALATALTLAALTVLGSHHAPAAATAVLVGSGMTAPGRPLYGLVGGLVLVMILAPALARLPGGREPTIELED